VVSTIPLTPILFLFSLPEAHLEGKGVTGKRKPESEPQKADDDSDGDDGGGGDDDSDDSTKATGCAAMGTATKNKKDTPSKNKGADVDVLIERMKKTSLMCGTSEMGFYFNCSMPHIWWTYYNAGTKYLKFEFQMWGCQEEDVNPQIGKEGDKMRVRSNAADQLVGMDRLHRFQYDTVLPVGGGSDNMYQNVLAVEQAIRTAYDMQGPYTEVEITLPFKCRQRFHDPYKPDDKGHELDVYPVDASAQGLVQQVYILSVNLVALDQEHVNQEGATPFRAYGFDPHAAHAPAAI
jgi:hypothetical protein